MEQVPSKTLLLHFARLLRSGHTNQRDLDEVADLLLFMSRTSDHDIAMRDHKLVRDEKTFAILIELQTLLDEGKTRVKAIEALAERRHRSVDAIEKRLQRGHHLRKGLLFPR